jgi:hypothetical protein
MAYPKEFMTCLAGVWKRTHTLLSLDILPIFVLDGAAPLGRKSYFSFLTFVRLIIEEQIKS